mgnify:CR=1 FL=1
MCGVAGYLRIRPETAGPMAQSTADRMLGAIWRRGPDGQGQWRSKDEICWLGHRRLAIIDLVTGDQPMSNEDGSVWTVFNGEIYNYMDLRAELVSRGHIFRSASDTEVLVHGYEEWGGDGLVRRLRGIFAFAIYDTKGRSLFLARDHLGVKPLYWSWDGKVFLFGSEIKALLVHPALEKRTVSHAGVAQFLVTRYVSRPNTMFERISRLPEGSWMIIKCEENMPPRPVTYWDVRYDNELQRVKSLDEGVDALDRLLTQTVEMQLVADVPVGAQLSGGVDSSIIVALMQKALRERGESAAVKTFSVGFDVEGFSELNYARMIATRYGTDHHEIQVGFKEFFDELAMLCWIYDEPVGEPPAIPTYLMCKKAKEKVTVMLCGEGADELFGGYNKYAFDQYSRYIDWLPGKIRRTVLRGTARLLPFRARRQRSILEILGLDREAERYASWYGAFDTALQKSIMNPDIGSAIKDHFIDHAFEDILQGCDSRDSLNRFLYCDIHSRLVDDLLVKADRMSMGASIEARVPFLDHHIVEFASSLPRQYKIQGLRTKIILKKLAERYAPNELIYRRKVGFTVPLSRWFVGPLRNMVNNVLLGERSVSRGYWREEALRKIVMDHLDGRVDREQGIWVLLALEFWHRLYVDDDGSESAARRLQESIRTESSSFSN